MIGKTIAQYRILEKLGAGGLGVVYRAEDTKLQRIVALKFLRPEILGKEEHRARFLREARAAAALDHPNICTIYEIGEFEGEVFIAMAFIDGIGLEEKTAAGPLPVGEAVTIAVQIAEALRAAHERGLVHRDVKSANVRITSRGQAKLLDFGLAKRAGEAEMTQAGTLMGTVACMSPEQARGERADQRTDIWSLGVMLYEMLAGRLPFRADNPVAVLHAVLHEVPERLTFLRPEVPEALERIVARALAKNPDERYPDVDQMLEDLRLLMSADERARMATVIMPAATGAAGVSRAGGGSGADGGSRAMDGSGGAAQESPWRRLWASCVLQTVGLYAVASAAVVFALREMVERYPISPKLPQFVLVLLACLVPSVALIAAGRSRRHAAARRGTALPGPSLRTRVAGIAVNAVAAAVLLAVLFQGQQLGAATTKVALLTEDGRTITREVPKAEFLKRVAVFLFDNEGTDREADWLASAIDIAIEADLSQDPYLYLNSEFYAAMREAGFPDGVRVPWGLKRNIAAKAHYPYFLCGTYRLTNDTLRIEPVLYETASGKLVERHALRGPLELSLIDSLTVQLKRDLGIPGYHIARTEDLPLTTLLTESIDALRETALALFVWLVTNDYAAAAQHLERAVAIDPTFAYAHLFLAVAYTGMGRQAEAQTAYSQAFKHEYKLSEMQRFLLRAQYHYARQDFRAGLAAAKSWVRLQPQSISAHQVLSAGYVYANLPDSAIAELKTILVLDPEQQDVLQRIGSLCQGVGRLDEALGYYQQYAARFPNDAESYTAIAALYRAKGKYDEAKRYYEQARVLEPGKISTLRRLAELDMFQGDCEAAERQLLSALERGETVEERSQIHQSLAQLYIRRGQIGKAIASSEEYIEGFKAVGAPAQATALRMTVPLLRAQLGQAAPAMAELRALGQEDVFASTGFHWVLSLGVLGIFTTLEDPAYLDEAHAALEEARRGVEATGIEMAAMPVIMAAGQILMIEGDYARAIPELERSITIAYPDEEAYRGAYLALARCYRELGKPDEAESWVRRILDVDPLEPRGLDEAARIAWARGDHETARATMRRALEVWEAADPGFIFAARARQTLAEWEAGV